jgi:outer membrane receptor for ferrienterochelin and colicin
VFARRFYLLALAASTACASAGTAAPAGRNSNVISEDEIAASHEANAYEVIRTLRPLFLKSRGRSSINGSGTDYATVFVDGQQYGDLTTLRNVVASQIREIRYYSAADAMTRFGMQAGGGAIDIRTK